MGVGHAVGGWLYLLEAVEGVLGDVRNAHLGVLRLPPLTSMEFLCNRWTVFALDESKSASQSMHWRIGTLGGKMLTHLPFHCSLQLAEYLIVPLAAPDVLYIYIFEYILAYVKQEEQGKDMA